MSDRAAQLRTLATSFYREMMRLADEMDAKPPESGNGCTCAEPRWSAGQDPACPVHAPLEWGQWAHSERLSAMDPALDC